MTRFRATLLAALAGILITTGGCADSATAPTAAVAPSLDRALGDSIADSHRPASHDDDGLTVQSGFIKGGG
jgi:hypothetical protein